ncbi:uncharacterized protein IUM83_06263 [Phytophthora cinnamomi]|uniref:uncharacterized protein n=1 Tax=Phytophthora cinnamomi TaxID=4785 RepID=UPI0035595744|nr:hypothetical protein IUM83_06263 [Phytophthora cinnamomi]
MDRSALYPPNHQGLSDTVIGAVLLRVRATASASSDAAYARDASALPSLQESRSQLPSIGSRVHLAVSSDLSSGPVCPPLLSVQQDQHAAQRSAVKDLELRRERNRMHQARHKMKQRQKMLDLESSIQQLREDIQELKLQREVLSVGVMTNTTIWNVAAEYFRLFRYGVQVPESASQHSTMVLRPKAEAQRHFLLATTASSVVSESGYGTDALMENWSFVSRYHPDIDIQLTCLENNAEGFMVGRTLGRLTITENTLRNAFPHLVDAEEEERIHLADKLLCQ